jgi:hypothetical protein
MHIAGYGRGQRILEHEGRNMPDMTYYRKLLSLFLLVAGGFLLGEHIATWGGADIDDPIGHETYGIIMLIAAYIVSARYKGKYVIGK